MVLGDTTWRARARNGAIYSSKLNFKFLFLPQSAVLCSNKSNAIRDEKEVEGHLAQHGHGNAAGKPYYYGCQ